jgi:HK97 family phage prohead protease
MSEEHEILRRDFPVDFAEVGDGRTIDARIVPYDVPARVADPPTYRPYEESFVRGAFERQTQAANRVKVWLNFEHEQGIRGIVGHGIALEDRDDGLYGSFRVHENPDGDKALSLVRQGLLTGLSLEFAALKSRVKDGVTQRLRAHIDKVSLCRDANAAYQGAEVLAVRQSPEVEDETQAEPEAQPQEEAPAPQDPQPEDEDLERMAVDEMLERVGYEPLLMRAVTKKPWDGSASRFTDEQYQRSCLIDRGGDDPVKERCSLPVKEPNGDVNANALGQAAARLNQVASASPEQKASAARKLRRYYSQASMEPPPSLMAMASR